MPEPTLPSDEAAAPDPAAADPADAQAASPGADDGDAAGRDAGPAAPDARPAAAASPATDPAARALAELSPAACGARLAALFPALFGRQRPLPLKLRIQADIQQRAPGVFSRKTLSAFLHRHTTGTPYLVALSQSQQRFDLDGAAAGELAEEHRAAATAELARRRSVHDARRAAAQAAVQRERAADNDARRERAALLRAFETTTLTRANFCALKGIAETALDALLAAARLERAQRPSPAAHGAPEPRRRPRDDERGRRPRRPAAPGNPAR